MKQYSIGATLTSWGTRRVQRDYAMGQSPSSKATGHSANEEIPQVHYRIHKRAHRWSLTSVRWTQSILSHPICPRPTPLLILPSMP